MKSVTINMRGDTAEVLLYDPIGADMFGDGISAKDFRAQIKAVKAKALNLRINSPGGSVFEASAMLAALDEFRGTIVVDIDGVAASAASVVAMAGDEIRMAPAALLMVHDPSAIVIGGADDMRGMADLLEKTKDQLIDAYERHSKAGRDQIAEWMTSETWFGSQEAVDAGFADSVAEGRQVAACANLKEVAAKLHYKHVPTVLTARDEKAWQDTDRRRAIAAKLCSGTPAA